MKKKEIKTDDNFVVCPRCHQEVYKDAIICPFCKFGIMVWLDGIIDDNGDEIDDKNQIK